MRRCLIAGLVVLGTALGVANPAVADGTGDAFIDGDEIGAGAQDGVQSGPGTGGSNACHYEILSDDDQNAAYSLADDSWGNLSRVWARCVLPPDLRSRERPDRPRPSSGFPTRPPDQRSIRPSSQRKRSIER